MKILAGAQIREIDRQTIEKEPIASIDLMERAANELLSFIIRKYPSDWRIALFAGPGNNGGDAVALARLLVEKQYRVELFTVSLGAAISDDNQTNIERLNPLNVPITNLTETSSLPELNKFDALIDGIFGSGLSRAVTQWPAQLIVHMNESRKPILSIDIPSGLFSEDNSQNTGVVVNAAHTVSFQFPKLAFMLPENETYVGKWRVQSIGLLPQAIKNEPTRYHYTTIDDLPLLKTRRQFAHKGDFGHALLVAGSYGKTGAAILAAKACLRSGAGLLSVHVPETAYSIIQAEVPEAMVVIDETEQLYCAKEALQKYTCIGAGPGIGLKQSMKEALLHLLNNSQHPVVLDADALNIIAAHKSMLKTVPPNSIITPHPKEFDRLTHTHETHLQRINSAIDLATQHQLVVVLKGAHTAIATPDGNVYFNSSGNPGLAKGGSGDTLAGIMLALLANGYTTIEAAKLGVFIHGLAADLATDTIAIESLLATDVIEHISNAFVWVKHKQQELWK